MNSILVVTPNYPTKDNSVYPFIRTLCKEFIKNGKDVEVLAPQSVTAAILHRRKMRPRRWEDVVDGSVITIHQPYTLTPLHGMLRLYNFMIRLSALCFLRKNNIKPDVCYCHFWCSAYFVMPYMKKNKIPMIVASGESEIKSLLSIDRKYPDFKEYVKGVVCVSSKNQEESISLGFTTREKCGVFPNAIDSNLFYKRNQKDCRIKLGLPQDGFIVAFVGWFIERKGPRRVTEAIQKVGGVKSIFIGKGDQEPLCEGILFRGSVPHEEVPLYLGAADVFVLPTQHEGCCNAVVEAMACGLPVISSNQPFNWDVLDESNSIMVDPNNVDEIAEAIKTLKDNPAKRAELAEGALKKAELLTIDQRAERILDFIESKI